MTKHTPGPWTTDSKPSRVVNTRAGLLYVRAPFGGVIAGAFVGRGNAEENARLITAAPEMADALTECVATLGNIDRPSIILSHDEAVRLTNLARSALAKAGVQ